MVTAVHVHQGFIRWCFFVPVLFCFGLFVQEVSSRENTKGKMADAPYAANVLGRSAVRPRLFFTAERLRHLKQNIKENPQVKEAWEGILKRANRLLRERLVSKEYAEGGTGQHGNYGRPSSQISGMASTLGLAYQMTGEVRYAEKLKQALRHFGGLKRWAGDAKRDPPWHSELNTARFCYGYGVGYDSIYNYLSEAERGEIAGAMVRLGILPTLEDWILPGKRIHALDSMGHNWWSVCVSMAGVAALSVWGDEPRAEAWLEIVSPSFQEWFGYQGNVLQNKSVNFDRQGAFYESVNYANYALSEYLLFRLAYTTMFSGGGGPEIPLLEKVGDFFVQTCYPTSEGLLAVNFGDSSRKASGARTLWLLGANGYEKEAYHWYMNRTDRGLNDPVGLVNYKANAVTAAPKDLPTSMLYDDIGWAVMRSSWDDNATMLAVKSGFTWNHAHPDAGSFILFHEGKPVIIDSGNCSYSRREYTRYYRHSRAHNVILIDGEAQHREDIAGGDRGVKTPGRLYRLMDGKGIKYVLADATGPTAWKYSRNYRHFLWIDDVILIFDDVRAHEAGKLEWLLHFEDSYERAGSEVILSNGDRAKVRVKPVYPVGMEIIEKEGLKDHDPDTKVTYLAFAPGEPRREGKFITALVPWKAGKQTPSPRIELLEGDEMLGVRVSGDKEVTEVYLNLRADGRRMHRNSNKVIQGWDTDAYLFGVTRPKGAADDPDKVSRYLVACGSYLRKDGTVVLHALSKVYGIFATGGGRLEGIMQGQPVLRAAIRASHKPTDVIMNGQAIHSHYDSSDGLVWVDVQAH